MWHLELLPPSLASAASISGSPTTCLLQLVCHGTRGRPCRSRLFAEICHLWPRDSHETGQWELHGIDGEQDLRCLPVKLLANSESRVSPCSLHIALGLVKLSTIDNSMLRRTGEAIVQSALYGPAGITSLFSKVKSPNKMNTGRCVSKAWQGQMGRWDISPCGI